MKYINVFLYDHFSLKSWNQLRLKDILNLVVFSLVYISSYRSPEKMEKSQNIL